MPISERLNLKKPPIFLMDGSAYVYRSFYAYQNMSRADGTQTNVLYMVLRLLFKILRKENPSYFSFVLDGKGKNFRHELFPSYKANRSATPEALIAQLDPLKRAIQALGIHLLVSENCEADDCIATLANRFKSDASVVILGADKDLRQCLGPNVSIWDPSAKEERITTLESFVEEYAFAPEYWADYQAIVGDSSDNIPGVTGIGAKGASKLITEFKNLEEIQNRLVAVPPPLRKKLEGQFEQAFLYRQLTTLKIDCCPPFTLEEFAPTLPDEKALMEILNEYELRSLAREFASMMRIVKNTEHSSHPALNLGKVFAVGGMSLSPQVEKQTTEPRAENLTNKAGAATAKPGGKQNTNQASLFEAAPLTGFSWSNNFSGDEQNSLFAKPTISTIAKTGIQPENLESFTSLEKLRQKDELVLFLASNLSDDKNDLTLLLGDGHNDYLFPLSREVNDQQSQDLINQLLESKIIASNLKELLECYPALENLPLAHCFDLSLAAWLLNPEEYDYSFQKINRLWGQEAEAFNLEQSKFENSSALSALALGLYHIMHRQIKSGELEPLMQELELPLIPVLLSMQKIGIHIDKPAFAEFLAETEKELELISKEIYKLAHQEFNIRSSRQLAAILFDELKLPQKRKTSGGQASTSQETLEMLIGKHAIVEKILEFRKLEKLRSTYLDPLPKLADEQSRLHTSFNQIATATGRLSSSNPNLQNIPIRGVRGERMRSCFTAAPGKLLASADYSQIELRVLAHLSQDPTLLNAFLNDEDIHRRTASLLFDVIPSAVSNEERSHAKTINFGLIYGMGPQKLAQDLGISMIEAKKFISRYFEKLSKLKEYFEHIEASAKELGYVSTMTGRRRACPDINSASPLLNSRARRQAINTCIQGSAADIIKIAMLKVQSDKKLKSLGAELVLQIHDELLLECPEENAKAAGRRLAKLMEEVEAGGQKLSVPLRADWSVGISWALAH